MTLEVYGRDNDAHQRTPCSHESMQEVATYAKEVASLKRSAVFISEVSATLPEEYPNPSSVLERYAMLATAHRDLVAEHSHLAELLEVKRAEHGALMRASAQALMTAEMRISRAKARRHSEGTAENSSRGDGNPDTLYSTADTERAASSAVGHTPPPDVLVAFSQPRRCIRNMLQRCENSLHWDHLKHQPIDAQTLGLVPTTASSTAAATPDSAPSPSASVASVADTLPVSVSASKLTVDTLERRLRYDIESAIAQLHAIASYIIDFESIVAERAASQEKGSGGGGIDGRGLAPLSVGSPPRVTTTTTPPVQNSKQQAQATGKHTAVPSPGNGAFSEKKSPRRGVVISEQASAATLSPTAAAAAKTATATTGGSAAALTNASEMGRSVSDGGNSMFLSSGMMDIASMGGAALMMSTQGMQTAATAGGGAPQQLALKRPQRSAFASKSGALYYVVAGTRITPDLISIIRDTIRRSDRAATQKASAAAAAAAPGMTVGLAASTIASMNAPAAVSKSGAIDGSSGGGVQGAGSDAGAASASVLK